MKLAGVHIPAVIKNYIQNGDMALSQRNTTFTAVTAGVYTLDRMRYDKSGATVHTVTQDSDVPTQAQSGYQFSTSYRFNLTTPDTSIAAGDYALMQHRVEGYNFSAIAQKTFTLSFWVKATLPGIYCVAFKNSGSDRSYVAEYTINNTATWEYKTITVVGGTTNAGTWNYTNGIGLDIVWTLAAGSTFQTTAGSWNTGLFLSTANQVNGVNTGATDFRLTGLMLNEGAVAMPFQLFSFASTQSELASCQRYYEKSYNLATFPGASTLVGSWKNVSPTTNSDARWEVGMKVNKRTTPTATVYSTNGAINNIRNINGASDVSAGVSDVGEAAFKINSSFTDQVQYAWQWTAESEL